MTKKVAALIICAWLAFPFRAQADDFLFGTTFSRRQCDYLELDWKEVYRAVLDLPFDIIRLGAYWNEIEKERDKYDFSELDWQVQQARNRNMKIVLTVGMKAPRWPEYYIPEWVTEDIKLGYGATVSRNVYLQKRTLDFVERVIHHYRDEMAISYWQVENEALNRFGGKRWRMDKEFLEKEVELVKNLDPHDRPIILTASTYPNAFLRIVSRMFTKGKPVQDSLELCDILGINVYPKIGQKFWGQRFYFRSGKNRRLLYFGDIIQRAKEANKEIWVTELQAEPWEPGLLVYKFERHPPTGLPSDTQLILEEMRGMGYNTFLFWGAEYWYYQKTVHENPEWWEMITDILEKNVQELTR